MVAWTTLMGLLLPCDFVKISRTPAACTTARTAALARTPVPGAAGRRSTCAPPNLLTTCCGTLLSSVATSISERRAMAPPFCTASGTSAALPSP